MEIVRKNTKEVHIGDRVIGGGNPILIQSMTNTKTENVAATVEQIHRLTEAGCRPTGMSTINYRGRPTCR
jgi:4-hydroxy-3-methylbut-2-en-1-yl diphosphate synthase IspG/GcpE